MYKQRVTGALRWRSARVPRDWSRDVVTPTSCVPGSWPRHACDRARCWQPVRRVIDPAAMGGPPGGHTGRKICSSRACWPPQYPGSSNSCRSAHGPDRTAMYLAYAVGAPVSSALYAADGFAAIAVATTLIPLVTLLLAAPLRAVAPAAHVRPSAELPKEPVGEIRN
jgi:hypothetical protein